jgi:hypothetical protein
MSDERPVASPPDTGHRPDYKANPMRVIRNPRDGLAYVAVADFVALCRDMASTLKDGPGKDSLNRVAESLIPALADGELLPAGDDLESQRCAGCVQRVYRVARANGQDIVLNAAATPYGRWIIFRSAAGHHAAPHDPGKHSRLRMSRYREHDCVGQQPT